jgi:hypothetical protein
MKVQEKQFQDSKIRKGYKQTEVGVIPEDWVVRKLGDVTSLMTNGFVGEAKSHYTESNYGILYIQGYNIEENRFNFNGIKRVTTEFNKIHGITPKGVVKRIKDIIDGVYDVDEKRQELKYEQEKAHYEDMSEKQLSKEIKQLEKMMVDHAKNLEFEKAAQTRDQLLKLKAMVFGAELHDTIQLNGN